MKIIIISCLLAACGLAAAVSDWKDLRGSFLILKDESFAPFPRTIREERFTSENWVPTSSVANDCENGGKFNGVQYVKNNDYSVGLLYDVNGVIAGIQMLIAHKDVLSENNTLKYDVVTMYNNATYNNEEYFVLTAYFVNPSTICSEGRTDSALATDGTGTGLWIQNGPTAETLLEVPQTRPEDPENNNGWTVNNCFPAMGYHNFYKQNEYRPKNCTEMQPVFGLWNKDSKLHGFGFIVPGTVNNPRFEHPPQSAIKSILGDAPQCVLDIEENIGVTSIHIYFVERPLLITCSIIKAAGSYLTAARNWIRSVG